ncbi:MAG: protoheme IX farnesyltransferase [Chloroflexi bacterium]|nr:protoheme IX farnesyltransferase [Chloroflexota bacterium]
MSYSDTTKKAIVSNNDLTNKHNKWREWTQIIVVLFKLRIVFLLLMAATAGAFLTAGGWPSFTVLLLVWVTGGMAAAGSSAINEYWERNTDGNMERTQERPLVTGQIKNPTWVPIVGIALIFIPSLIVLTFNPQMAFFLLLGAFIYVGIYTIWLKPRTLLNIVIGGAAGSAAVLTGSAAVGAWNAPGALILAAILFLWTPFHFWSLALVYRDEYARSDVPMLPVHTTPHRAAWFVMAHTLPTCLAGLLLATLPSLGLLYLIPVIWVTADLFWCNVRLIQDPSPTHARALFMSSNIYLLVLLVAICASTIITSLLYIIY